MDFVADALVGLVIGALLPLAFLTVMALTVVLAWIAGGLR